MNPKRNPTQSAGIGVDAFGGGVIDPTANVIALVEANKIAADSLRLVQDTLTDEKIKRVELLLNRDDRAMIRETAHIKEIVDLRAAHAKETRAFDTERYDKIRSVDMANAAATASQILQAVNTNASAQERTAQTLRDQVASTAQAQENRQAAFAADMVKRLSAVELSMSKGEGKQQVADPALERLAAVVEKLANREQNMTGKGEGLDKAWAILLGIVALAGLWLGFTNRQQAAPQPVPQVIYVPQQSQSPAAQTTTISTPVSPR